MFPRGRRCARMTSQVGTSARRAGLSPTRHRLMKRKREFHQRAARPMKRPSDGTTTHSQGALRNPTETDARYFILSANNHRGGEADGGLDKKRGAFFLRTLSAHRPPTPRKRSARRPPALPNHAHPTARPPPNSRPLADSVSRTLDPDARPPLPAIHPASSRPRPFVVMFRLPAARSQSIQPAVARARADAPAWLAGWSRRHSPSDS